MDKHKKLIMASLLLDSRLYQALPPKVRDIFLSKLSASYPSLFNYQRDDEDEETIVGYEAAWAAAGKQFK